MRNAGAFAEQSPGSEVDKRETHYLDRMRHHSRNYREFHWRSVELVVNLFYTYDVLQARLAREAEREGLSATAFNVLMILSRCGERGSPMHELGELLLVSRANVTGLVQCLEKRGLVERVSSEEDRRVRLVRLTGEGRGLLEGILPRHYGEVRATLKGLSEREKSDMSRLLTKLRRGVQRAGKAAGGR
jgi:MarR family transcriptional regulator, 2-MHQ and catechol-resistance regulon repressor